MRNIFKSSGLINNFKGNTQTIYSVWVAHYHVSEPSYTGKYDIWQKNNNGSCPGISGPVDENIGYTDFEKNMKELGMNGFDKESDKEK